MFKMIGGNHFHINYNHMTHTVEYLLLPVFLYCYEHVSISKRANSISYFETQKLQWLKVIRVR